ncbi:MAG: winged helix-turn-helix domain-containing protein [Zestosphaera sp.]
MSVQVDELGRVALRIYVYLLESSEPRGVREIARALEIPVSSVYYHLKRLEDLGFIGRRGDGYVITRMVTLEGYVLLGRKLIPRLAIYSLFFLGIALGEVLVIATTSLVDVDRVLLIASCALAFILFTAEALNMRSRLRLS